MAGFKVNFSDDEASSEARTFEAMPTGEYYVRVTDVEDAECGPNSKNPGKPYYKVEFTVQDGPHEDRKLWANAMLFNGALYTIAQLMKATGFEKELAKGDIPEGEKFVSKECIVVVKRQLDTYAMERDDDGVKQYKNEVKGIKKYEGVSPTSKSTGVKAGSGSLLP